VIRIFRLFTVTFSAPSWLPPRFFGFAYIAMIPLFAGIYALFPRGFQLGTVQAEPATIRSLASLDSALEGDLDVSLGLSSESRPVGTSYIYHGASLSGLRLHSVGDPVLASFDLAIPIGDSTGVMGSLQFQVSLFNGSQEESFAPRGKLVLGDAYAVSLSTRDANGLLLRDLFPLSAIDFTGVDGVMWFSRSATTRLSEVSLLANGIPPSYWGRFCRMLYFSTVTITTLGFGEIVPLAPATRFFVGLQAIGGVIVIGLFLNSLSRVRDSIPLGGV
jgi:hypothetical protein